MVNPYEYNVNPGFFFSFFYGISEDISEENTIGTFQKFFFFSFFFKWDIPGRHFMCSTKFIKLNKISSKQ